MLSTVEQLLPADSSGFDEDESAVSEVLLTATDEHEERPRYEVSIQNTSYVEGSVDGTVRERGDSTSVQQPVDVEAPLLVLPKPLKRDVKSSREKAKKKSFHDEEDDWVHLNPDDHDCNQVGKM